MAQTLPNGVVVPLPDGGENISPTGVAEMRALGSSADAQLAVAKAQAAAAVGAVADVDSGARARDAALEAAIAGMEGMTYVGAWQSGRTYRINDVVTHGGDSWARLTAGSAGIPGDPQHWGLVARKGDGGGFGDLAETDVAGLYDTVEAVIDQSDVTGLVAALDAKVGTSDSRLTDARTPTTHQHPITDVNGLTDRLAALEYSTGWRDVTSLLAPVSGRLLILREGRTVWLDLQNLVPSAVDASALVLRNVIPAGFRISRDNGLPLAPRVHDAANEIRGSLRCYINGDIAFYRVIANATARGVMSYRTADPVPSVLPGTPA